jgi:hypothetical protein
MKKLLTLILILNACLGVRATSITTVGTTLFCGPNASNITPFKQSPDWIVWVDMSGTYRVLSGDNSKYATSNDCAGLLHWLDSTYGTGTKCQSIQFCSILGNNSPFFITNTVTFTNGYNIWGIGNNCVQLTHEGTGAMFQLGDTVTSIGGIFKFANIRFQGQNANEIGVYSLNCAEPNFVWCEFNQFSNNLIVTNYGGNNNAPNWAGCDHCWFVNAGGSTNWINIFIQSSAENCVFNINDCKFNDNGVATDIMLTNGCHDIQIIANHFFLNATPCGPIVDVQKAWGVQFVNNQILSLNYNVGTNVVVFEPQASAYQSDSSVANNIKFDITSYPFGVDDTWVGIGTNVLGVWQDGNNNNGHVIRYGDASQMTNNVHLITNNYNIVASDSIIKFYMTNGFVTNNLNIPGRMITIISGSATASAVMTNVNSAIFTLPTGGYATNAVYLGGATGSTNMWTGICDQNGNW